MLEGKGQLDYGKAKYEAKKDKAKRRRTSVDASLKEITFGFKTSEHDLLTKAKKAREMLEEGHHVRLTVRLFGRQLSLLAVAQKQLDFVEAQLKEVAKTSIPAVMKGGRMSVTLMPLPSVTARAKEALRSK